MTTIRDLLKNQTDLTQNQTGFQELIDRWQRNDLRVRM